jgi:hypothetical protein
VDVLAVGAEFCRITRRVAFGNVGWIEGGQAGFGDGGMLSRSVVAGERDQLMTA